MPGIPVAARATSSHPDACEHLSAEEELAAEESLSIYCKPVELYNILQRRAMRNPSFLQRCLHYRIKAKHKKRIQMAVSLTRTITESQNVFPMSICLARRISDHGASRANFTLPEVNKLAEEARSCSLDILFVSTATVENSNLSSGVNSNSKPSDLNHLAFFESGEYCLCGKVSLESLYMAWDCFPNFRLGQRAEIMSTVDLLPCILKSDFLNEDTRISIQVPSNFENMSTSKQVQITISAEEFGAKEKSPYLSYAGGEVPSSSLSHIIGTFFGNWAVEIKIPPSALSFAWRLLWDRLPSKDNLISRQIALQNDLCPFCQSQVESASHLFFTCYKVMPLWWEFNSWVKEDRVLHSKPMDNFLQHCSLAGSRNSNRRRKIWWIAATRSIWSLRNDMVFNNQSFDISKLMDRSIYLTWSWLRGWEKDFTVPFHQWYYNNKLQRTEVTKDFTCPFCLVKCACFKGLRCHLSSSHDLFNFEFWVSDECHAVNVSVKNDISRSEIVSDDVDPRVQTFFFCGKPLKRRTSKDQSSKNAVGLESSFPAGETDMLEKDDGISATIIRSHPDRDSVPSMSDCDQAVLQFAKTRKLSIERPDPRNSTLLRKRQFFHSHKAQPMAIEQVVSDKDSEDEVDDDVADFEDRRMLENFVDVSKDEKSLMHMWNSFVRKHRVIADGHISWACEAFSKLHAPEFVQSPSLAGCWRIFMVKLYNHGLLDARTMNDCNIILEQYQRQNSDPKR
ncbi:Polycomb group protein EMF2B [Glycine max]|nr:Polycomb group protein EMF2B [Glycine max]